MADWVCAGGTGSGYPKYAYTNGPEIGYLNLAVFYQACNFDCLYCQNWHYREGISHPNFTTVEELVNAAYKKNVSCICFFGGDPTPQLDKIIRMATPRARVAIALMAFSGLRPQSLGNFTGTDGIRLGDFIEAEVSNRGIKFH